MGRHRLTLEEKIHGVQRALASPRTPDQLKPGLEGYLKKLRERRGTKLSARIRPKGKSLATLWDWLRV